MIGIVVYGSVGSGPRAGEVREENATLRTRTSDGETFEDVLRERESVAQVKEVSIFGLLGEYDQNPVAAKAKYEDSTLHVSGIVRRILPNELISLNVYGYENRYSAGVWLERENRVEQLSSLRRHQKVAFECPGNEVYLEYPHLVLMDCRLLEVQPVGVGGTTPPWWQVQVTPKHDPMRELLSSTPVP